MQGVFAEECDARRGIGSAACGAVIERIYRPAEGRVFFQSFGGNKTTYVRKCMSLKLTNLKDKLLDGSMKM